MEDGYTKEEWKMMMGGPKKILIPRSGLPLPCVTGAALFVGHSEAVNIESRIRSRPTRPRDILRKHRMQRDRQARRPGGTSRHERAEGLRGRDLHQPHPRRTRPWKTLVLGCVSDNLRKGAAMNAFRSPKCPDQTRK